METLDVRWIHGSRYRRRNTDPPIQVHRYDERTVIMRQNKAVHFEAPFLYLLMGSSRALLLDTGATADPEAFPLRATVDGLVPPGLDLVVVHSHGHGDHVAGDGQFADRPATVVVPATVDAVREFFGPDEWAAFDLGDRVLEVSRCPGHDDRSIVIYDPATGFLLTGDTVLPGRLYIQNLPAFRASLDRLVAFTESRPVSYILGCHIELTRTGRDFPWGATYQPGEAPLPMTVEQLVALRAAAYEVPERVGLHRRGGFIFVQGAPKSAMVTHLARGAWHRLRHWAAPSRVSA